MFFFFNDTATTEIYTLSLHDALPISASARGRRSPRWWRRRPSCCCSAFDRSEEHTSELQSQSNLVCRLLLEKKKQKKQKPNITQHIKWKALMQYFDIVRKRSLHRSTR